MADWKEQSSSSEGLKIDIFSILRDLLKDWWMIVSAGIVGYMCAYVIMAATYVPVYTSSATLTVTEKGVGSTVVSNLSAARTKAETLSKLLDSNI